MATYTQDEKIAIIKTQPQKVLVNDAQDCADKLMLLIHGHGMNGAIQQNTYFENGDVYAVRKAGTMSNKDLFGRLFQKEQMVFTAQGGSSYYTGLTTAQVSSLNETLDDVIYSMSLRDWINEFALPAFRCDPMGIIFIEADKQGQNAYPTYKSIKSIWNYLPNGRKLEHVCFKLTVADLITFGIKDEAYASNKPTDPTQYFRFVDDSSDDIYNNTDSTVALINTIPNPWPQTPAFILSNIISFENAQKFLSPIHLVTELAEGFMNDRSIRDLQKKFHGFLKAIEPLLMCGICMGTGYLSSSACPECTPAGGDKGTGFKLKTKVADIARFPLAALKDGFDFNKIFGYVNLPIDVWDKQDRSLSDIENLINYVYWGINNDPQTNGPSSGDKNVDETATKTLANLKPVYARLNITADWAEKTENMIATFIGQYLYKSSFKKSIISYGRYYILETPFDLMEEYLSMKTRGASQSSLFEALKRYTHSMYASDPAKLAVELKMINVEPFVHNTVAQVQANNPASVDYYSKLYFSEWKQQQDFDYLVAKDETTLRTSLVTFATTKQKLIPELVVAPAVAVAERITS